MPCNNDSVYEVDLGVTLSAYKTVLLSAANDDEAIQTAKALHDGQALADLSPKPWKPQWDSIHDERLVFLRNTNTGVVLLEDYRGSGADDVGAAHEEVPASAALFLMDRLTLLPQPYEVRQLLQTAQAALPLLKDGDVKSDLARAISVFSRVVALTTWTLLDVTEHRPDLSEEEARRVLAMMVKRHQCTDSDWALLDNSSQYVRKRPQDLEVGAKVSLRAAFDADGVVYPKGTAITVVEPEQGDNGAVVSYLVDLDGADASPIRASVESWRIEHPLEATSTSEGHVLTD